MIGTVEAIERGLMVDGFVRRYDTARRDDGLPPGEGVFLACSFWLVDAYVMLGRLDDARALFDRLLALRNDVGLLSEEYDPASGELLGNFPQAFSHVALVNSAFNLTRARSPPSSAPITPRRRGRSRTCRSGCSGAPGAPAGWVNAVDEALAPMLDVVLRQHLDQRAMPRAALVERHRQRLMDRGRDRLLIVRIDQQRRLAFDRGAGKARQDEHARIFGILRGDIFLGDEIHAVAQRRHQRRARGAVEAGQHRAAVGAVDVADRRPGRLAVAAVDAARRVSLIRRSMSAYSRMSERLRGVICR